MNLLFNELILKNSSMNTINHEKSIARRTTVIHEVYDGVNSTSKFEYELECALEAKTDYIVIEPTKLGNYSSCFVFL